MVLALFDTTQAILAASVSLFFSFHFFFLVSVEKVYETDLT